MSLDDRNKRASAVNPGCPWRGLLPFPDATLSRLDRMQVAYLYAGFTVNVTSSAILQKPIDYVMLGNQREQKKGRAHAAALRGIFRE